jgi:endo-1,4-beta-xylanase
MKFSLATVIAVASLASAAPVADPEPAPLVRREESLNEKFVAKGKEYFGTCADQGRLNAGSNAAIIKANFGQVTPENRFDSHPR